MFHNIFKSQKNHKIKQTTRQQIKPKILADIHEKNSLVLAELYSSKQIILQMQKLKIGDYLISNTIIERKTTSDFINSIFNKRLIQQLKQMSKYKQQILIIEGKLEQLYNIKNPNSIRGFLLSISKQIPIIFTKDSKDTAKYLITLAKQQIKKSHSYTLHSRIPKTTYEQKQYILESFPNIGPKTAEKLLISFHNLKNIFNASEQELQPILKKQTQKFRNLIDS